MKLHTSFSLYAITLSLILGFAKTTLGQESEEDVLAPKLGLDKPLNINDRNPLTPDENLNDDAASIADAEKRNKLQVKSKEAQKAIKVPSLNSKAARELQKKQALRKLGVDVLKEQAEQAGEFSRSSDKNYLNGSHGPSDEFALEEPSAIEEIFQGNFPYMVSRDLRQFGYDLFKRKPADFIALEDIPMSPDYVVGPGDAFTINVWGTSNFSYPITVRRDGTIFIPKVGSMKVWGETYKEMSKSIEKKLSAFFSGIKVNISFDSIKQIDVFVIGEVKQPGSYTISSTSSPINALFYAGGPTKDGSLRKIQVLRNNQVVDTIDLYEFLLKGSVNKLRLQSQDVVLVPVVGKMVAIAGNVKRPAIYEIQEKTSLYDALQMAGGLTFTGEIGRVSLERVNKNRERITKDYQIPENFASLADASKTELAVHVEDGDLIKVFPVQSAVKKTVYLRGHVKRPGSYEFKEGMSIRDLVKSYEDLKPEPYTDFAQIIRSLPPSEEKQVIFIDLKKVLDGDVSANLQLQDQDDLVIFSKEELNLREKVSIAGKVNKPGDFYFFKGMHLRDLIFMAGNLMQDAYLANAEIARYVVIGDDLKLERIQVNLKETMNENPSQNPELQPKDKVFVMGLPNWKMENFVTLSGEFRFPGQYPFLPGERLSSAIERAGGFAKKAFLPGAIFTRKSVKELQQKALKEQIAQLEEAVLQESVKPSEHLSAEDTKTLQESVIARKAMLKKLQEAQVSGRMIIELTALNKFKGSEFDIVLEAGDTLDVPEIPSIVTVMGEVYSPSSMVFVEGKTVQYYLEKAGGTNVNADNDSMFIIRADGSVVSRRQNRGFLLRNFYQTEISRGDAILVPKDISRFSWLNTTKDITDILFKIASTTGITITALK